MRRLIEELTPIPNTRSGNDALLECGHVIQTYGDIAAVFGSERGPVFCMRCMEEGYGCAAYVIYDRPSDYPDKIVTRKWIIGPESRLLPTRFVTLHETLDAAREALAPLRLNKQERFPADDPIIVEVWF